MMIIWSLLVLFSQADIPLKQKTEFEIKLDYKFKQRQAPEVSYDAAGNRNTSSNSILPYLILDIKILKLNDDEEKIKVNSNLQENILNRKVSVGYVYSLDLGFTEDVKDKVTANEYSIVFLSTSKRPIEKILILIDDEGNFFVNNEKRGRF